MGLLDGGLQQMFGAAFSGILLEGRHYHRVEERNKAGDVTAAVDRVQSIRGYRQTMTQQWRDAGFADAEAVLLIMQTYDGRVITPIERHDRIKLDGTWVAGNIDEDAAHAAWVVGVTRDTGEQPLALP